jgi:hypothetical protein
MMAHGLYHKTFYRRSGPIAHPERGLDRQRPVFHGHDAEGKVSDATPPRIPGEPPRSSGSSI